MKLTDIDASLASIPVSHRSGRVIRISAGRIEATGPMSVVGEMCEVDTRIVAGGRLRQVLAQIVAVEESRIVLVPLEPATEVLPDARVVASPNRTHARVGDGFMGRAVDAFGDAIDARPSPLAERTVPLDGEILAALDRLDSGRILETGIKALDGLLPIADGQRVGIFAASGVGKTTLIRQLASQIDCDHCVLCLVGERGGEVESLWRDAARQPDRFTCVAATSDQSAALRVRAVYQALALSEYWRGKRRRVVLIVDSITRFAMALRELGLAAGLPPTVRAYTPNVFAVLPRVVERCGAQKSGGSITAIFSVLSETDDVDDPIVEIMKSLLDGHIVLSRQLAEQGQFPAIDVLRSVSRQAERLMSPQHAFVARSTASLLSTYDESRLMIEAGLYKPGSNSRIDEAIQSRLRIRTALQQRSSERVRLADTLAALQGIVGQGGTRG